MAEVIAAIIGDDEVYRNLVKLEDKIQDQILAKAFEAAAEPIVSAIEVSLTSMVQWKTGNLQCSIGYRMRRYSGTVFATVGPMWPLGAHGHLVEFGHNIVTGGSISRIAKQSARRGKGLISGRTRSFPFEARAWESIKYIALAEVETKIAQGVAAVVG
jgi:hypothetical protein